MGKGNVDHRKSFVRLLVGWLSFPFLRLWFFQDCKSFLSRRCCWVVFFCVCLVFSPCVVKTNGAKATTTAADARGSTSHRLGPFLFLPPFSQLSPSSLAPLLSTFKLYPAAPKIPQQKHQKSIPPLASTLPTSAAKKNHRRLEDREGRRTGQLPPLSLASAGRDRAHPPTHPPTHPPPLSKTQQQADRPGQPSLPRSAGPGLPAS